MDRKEKRKEGKGSSRTNTEEGECKVRRFMTLGILRKRKRRKKKVGHHRRKKEVKELHEIQDCTEGEEKREDSIQ